MKKQHSFLAARPVFLMATALMLVGTVALAQESKTAKPETSASSLERLPLVQAPASHQALAPAPAQGEEEMIAEDEELIQEPLRVGDATQGLLAWQSSGDISSATPRPIAGVIANRSYERYLKSFEFPIPERMSSTVRSSSSNGGGK